MGTLTHPITLHSALGEASETLDALVDRGVLFAVFPESVLRRLGAAELERRAASDGIIRRLTQVEATLGEHRVTIMCVFGSDDEPARIGRHTLDTFLLEADIEKQELVPKTFRLIQHI